ncbi:MAG: GntR family transcriptional regulator [Aristaeellaceae bacterium]
MKKQILLSEGYSPLYKQLMQKLRSDIAGGIYPVHSQIPSEQELCDTYQVSRVTVRKALAELTQEGLLKRLQGKGTFVEVPRLCKDLRGVNSFHDACSMMGCTPGTRVIHAQMVRADAEDVRDLMLEEGAMVVELVRLRLADDTPVMLEINHFPASYAYLLEEDLTGSLYAILRRHGTDTSQAIHEISLSYATAAQARQLEVSTGDALLQLREVIYDHTRQPLHTSRQFIRGDRFTFRI